MGVGPSDFSRRVQRARPTCLKPARTGKSGALLAEWLDGTKAIVKVSRPTMPSGKRAQRGILSASHPRREQAFSNLAEAFGWGDLVPKVALFKLGGHEASAQAFVPAAKLAEFEPDLVKLRGKRGWPKVLERACRLAPRDQWFRLSLLDLVAGSRDRHSNNVGLRTLVEGEGLSHSLVAWDNAVTFGDTFRLYHNIFHRTLFRRSFDVSLEQWREFSALDRAGLIEAVGSLISSADAEHAWARHQFALEFPYKLPWKVISRGHDDPASFPTHESFFRRLLETDIDDNPLDLGYFQGVKAA